jgi:LPXTG-motif cell wall-anchored protein
MQPLGAGHIDGPSATLCVVPATSSWVLAAGIFLLGVTAAIIFTRRRPAWSSASR